MYSAPMPLNALGCSVLIDLLVSKPSQTSVARLRQAVSMSTHEQLRNQEISSLSISRSQRDPMYR